MRYKVPDWMIYGLIVLLIYLNANRASRNQPNQPLPPPELGELLPKESPRDPTVLVEIDDPSSGTGTAFAISEKGEWLTARHVVDSCDEVALQIGRGRGLRVIVDVSEDSDAAVLTADWQRDPIPADLDTRRQVGEFGFFFGFPQGRPGEAVGKLMGRNRLIIRGRYNTEEPVLAWAEVGRSNGLDGSLGGMSGAPVLDIDGEVIGIVAAESPRRGRVYSVAPRNLADYVGGEIVRSAEKIDIDRYGSEADDYRRERRIAQVICLVK